MRLKPALAAATASLALALVACGPNAQAEDDRPATQIIAEDGLAATEAALAARTQDAETAFLLGGVRALRAFETILQVRYANATEPLEIIPGMRTTLPSNPDAAFDPAFMENALKGALVHLAAAETALEPATAGEFATLVPLEAIWLDVNANGAREDWEGLIPLLFATDVRSDEEAAALNALTIRFDTADAEWLAAYVHLLSGMSELVLSLDPTPAITEIFDGRAALEAAGGVNPDPFFGSDDQIDMFAAALRMLDGTPDATRTRAALAHFRDMVSHNRVFWTEVMEESDNELEWLPNPGQTSVFGVDVDEELAETWMAVLDEADLVLKGEKLVPFWRIAQDWDATEGVGIDIASLLSDPGDFNVILMIQGATFAPHLKQGDFVSWEAWDRFGRMTRGDPLLFAAWFN